MDKKGLPLQDAKWYALRTLPRGEKMVLKRLELEGVRCMLPMAEIRRRWSDRVKMSPIPLVSSLVFVHCTPLRLKALLATKGVCGVRSDHSGEPIEVEQQSIDAIEEFSRYARGAFLASEGDIDRAMEIPWKRRCSQVVDVDRRYSYLYVRELDLMLCIDRN